MVSSSSVYSINLGYKVIPGKLTVGTYDGKNSKITVATHGERVLMMSLTNSILSHAQSGKTYDATKDDVTFLNINQPISSLSAGPISLADSEKSYLFIGTFSSIFAYDVENNKDLFYRDVPDGVSVITVGTLNHESEPIVVTGGNCSVQGFDGTGTECFWTVTGDNVGAIALLDFDSDGNNEMLVGSDDYDIRIFKNDKIIGETSETDSITNITPLFGNTFAYSLANGTIGVYEKLQRLWRIKSKNTAISIVGFDFDGDGVPELVTAWSNGKLDIRNIKNGEVLFKDNFKNPLAGLCTADINNNGKIHLLCCDVEGELKIYGASKNEGKLHYISPNVEQEAVRELSMKKHHLMLELKNYEVGTLSKPSSGKDSLNQASIDKNKNMGGIPNKTQLQTAFAINMGTEEKAPYIEITLATNNETIIRGALVFAEGIFAGECAVVHPRPDSLSSSITVPLSPPKNVPIDLHLKAYVGYRGSTNFHVFELTRQLPRFAMFALCRESGGGGGSSWVKVPLHERPSRITMWLNQNFLLAKELDHKTAFSVSFISLRSSDEICLQVESDGELIIKTIDMELAGDIIQCLSSFLTVEDLEVEAEFPDDISQIELLVRSIEEFTENNERLGADIAEQSGSIKTLLIRAEDARMIGDVKGMRKWYVQLHEVNKNLIAQHEIRCRTNENISESVKAVNQIIQRAARLRVGKPKGNMINECRIALKEQNIETLGRLIKYGASSSSGSNPSK